MTNSDNKALPRDLWNIVMDYKYGKYPENYHKLVVEPIKIMGWNYEYNIICKRREAFQGKYTSKKLHHYFQRIYEWEMEKYFIDYQPNPDFISI